MKLPQNGVKTKAATNVEKHQSGGARMSAVETATKVEGRSPTRTKRPRSAVTSGRKVFVVGDSNSAWARRFYDLVQGHVSDLGGRSVLSGAQLALIKRAAGLQCELEQMEGRMSLGQEINLDAYGRAASHLRRLLESLGLKREPRDVTTVDGEVAVFSTPMRSRWATEDAAHA
jgi:hypothetical protein